MIPVCHLSTSRATQPELFPHHELVRTDWKFEGSIGSELVSDVIGGSAVIPIPMQRIRESAAGELHRLAQAVGTLQD
jgi:hypothetical protein